MAYVTRKGTTVLHPKAISHAITEEAYHDRPGVVSEYRVYKRFAVRGEPFAEEGDVLMARQSDFRDHLAWVVNLTNGEAKHVPWDAMAHNVKPVEALAC